MELIYNILCLLIDLQVKIIDRIRPGWVLRNSSRINEWKLMAYAYSKSPVGVTGGFLVLILIIMAIIGPVISWEHYGDYPIAYNPELRLQPPTIPPWGDPTKSEMPLLGTDDWGRDVLAMTLYGIRISFVISILIVSLGVPLGIILGLIAGYKGGTVDEIVMRFTDMFMAFPGLILAIAFATVLPQRIRVLLESYPAIRDVLLYIFALTPQDVGQLSALLSVMFALVLVWWPGYARIVRGTVLSVKEQAFIEAARALGLSTRRILLKHLLPNIMSPILVFSTFDLATAALLAAALSFLGLGPQDPIPELGFMISKAGQFFPERSWWMVMVYGITLLLIAFGWNLLGDSLRDVLDPKTRRAIEVRFKRRR